MEAIYGADFLGQKRRFSRSEQMAAKGWHSKVDKVVGGDKSLKRQTVYSQELIYIQDPDKMQQAGFYSSISLSCPNCGAPIKKLGTKFCEYCGSGVKEINIRSWSFNDIKELNTQTKKYY